MKSLLTCNLSTGAVTEGDSAWTPRALVFGESLTLSLRFVRLVAGSTTDAHPLLDATRASIGRLDARPESSTWALQIGAGGQTVGNTTALLEYNSSAADLAAAINAKTEVTALYGTAKVWWRDGSWLIRLGAGAVRAELTVVENTLDPVSMGRVFAYQIDGAWTHEVRLTQAPLAFTDDVQLVLPEPPTIVGIRDGGGSETVTYNEIQALRVPADFRGSFYLQTAEGYRTAALSRDDDKSSIQAALEAVLGVGNVLTSVPEDQVVHIEFTGVFKGENLPLLEVVPLAPPPGDLTLTLGLGQAPLAARLRAEETVTEPLEVRIYETGGNPDGEVVMRQDLTFVRPLIWPDMALIPEIDWLRPLSPKTYKPFVRDNVITGHQFSPPFVLGNGVSTVFPCAHGLASHTVFVFVRENTTNGRQLVPGIDLSVRITNANSVTVTALGAAPATDSWVAVVLSAVTVAAFAEGLHVTTAQVDGLEDLLNALEVQVSALLALAPTTPLGTARETALGGNVSIDIPDLELIYPGTLEGGRAPSRAELPRPGYLLPALHVASATSAATLPALTGSAGVVYQNTSGGPLLIAGGGGTRSAYVAAGGFFGSDGRRFFPVTHAGATKSYFGRDLERELFEFAITAQMLRAGSQLTLSALLELQLLQANSRAQYMLVVERGTLPSQATPASTEINLQDVVWQATPMLSARVLLGQAKITYPFGVEIIRGLDGSLAANKVTFGFAQAADSLPLTADIALRGRLINFDTENSILDARGTIFARLTKARAEIK